MGARAEKTAGAATELSGEASTLKAAVDDLLRLVNGKAARGT